MKFQVTQCEPQATSAQAAQTSTLHKLHPRTGQVDPVAILERNGFPADRRAVHHGCGVAFDMGQGETLGAPGDGGNRHTGLARGGDGLDQGGA